MFRNDAGARRRSRCTGCRRFSFSPCSVLAGSWCMATSRRRQNSIFTSSISRSASSAWPCCCSASAAIIALPTRFFDLFVIPNLVGPDAALSASMTFLHYLVSRLLIGLLILHVGAALKHHFFD